MAPSKTAPSPQARAEVFTYEFVLQASAPGMASPDPGPDAAAQQAAVNAGYRAVGDSKLVGPETHADGESLVYRWEIPVENVKAAG